jgi:hypothetical protein
MQQLQISDPRNARNAKCHGTRPSAWPRLSLNLYLDDCAYAKRLAQMLRAAGHTVIIPADAGLARTRGAGRLPKKATASELLEQARQLSADEHFLLVTELAAQPSPARLRELKDQLTSLPRLDTHH